MAVEEFTLGNGLRVVLAPDPATPAVAVAVSYGVGSRSEPEGRAGFAHLFEHLMFQGSGQVPRLAHARLVEELGGVFNGSTLADSTVYHETVPPGGLERVLFLEADRMAGPVVTDETVAHEVEVVAAELRGRVTNRPYGRFPVAQLRALMFRTFANSHDGGSSLGDLTTVTVAEAQAFFKTFYGTGNAVLCVAGILPSDVESLVARHFDGVPGRPAPPAVDHAEPEFVGERRHREHDPRITMPAFGAAWRVPDPIHDLPGLLPYVVLAEILADTEGSALADRLLRTDRTAVNVSAGVELMGDPFAVCDPTGLVVRGLLPPHGDAEKVLRVLAEELERLADGHLGDLPGIKAAASARVLRNLDHVTTRATLLATFAQQRGDASLAADVPALLEAVTAAEVATAAATLTVERRAVVELLPGAVSPAADGETT